MATIKKSGANIHLQLVGTTYDKFHAGRNSNVGVTQAPLVTNSIPCFEVAVQAPSTNTATVFLGAGSAGCCWELSAGSELSLAINDVNKINVRAASGTQAINWLALQ